MLEFIKQYLSGEKWEKLCNSCYRIRYQEMGYQEIPAQYRGDGGIDEKWYCISMLLSRKGIYG